MFWDLTTQGGGPTGHSRLPRLGRHVTRLTTWVATVSIVGLVAAILMPFAAAGAAAPMLSVSGTPVPGGTILVVGAGFPKWDRIQLTFDGSGSGMPVARVDARSAFSVSVRIPSTAAGGEHTIAALGGKRSSEVLASIKIIVGHPVDPTPAPAPGATATPRPSATPVPTPRPSASPAPTPRPSATPVPTPRPSATPMPTPRPSATPTPPSGGSALYGPGIGSDSLGNQQVGGTAGGAPNTEVAYRFRATESSALTSIRVYVIGPGHPGYAGGTGGTFRVTVQADDGTAGHFPSGTVLATQTINPVDGVGLVITFPSPATLVAGRLYHVVFTNVDPSPTVNFASIDGLYEFAPTAPMQPSMADDDWGQSVRFQPNAWEAQRKLTPIMALTYANGRTAGVGYMEVWPYTYQSISGVATARERFTVSGATRTVSSVGCGSRG